MISRDIDNMIPQAIKDGNREYLKILKLIKAEFQRAKCKEGRDPKADLTEVEEAQVLLKMAEQRKNSIKEYIDANRQDLADIEGKELETIKKFLPEDVSDEEIENYTRGAVTAYKVAKEEGYELSMRDMKPLIEIVKAKYPAANSKVISATLMSILKK